ncbi:MAG: ABC transporter permease, partial [Eubacteriaceae bacterium]|nr:ABC transporter permease [Eubacteriaceae bacterium]
MQIRDFLREIWRTRNSFFSILMIIFLGSAAFSGLRSSGPDMKLSADAYFDSNSLMDIKLQNTLGIVQGDIDTVSSLNYVNAAEGGYTVDAYLHTRSENYVIKVHSLSKNGMNEPVLTRGELPKSNDECVIERNIMDLFQLEIGDTITIQTEEGLYDNSLKYSEFKVTGVVRSPMYMAFERGTSTIGNGMVTGFVIVNEECFDMPAFTEMYVRLQGADSLDCFSPEYADYAEKCRLKLVEVMEVRAEARDDEIEMIAGQTLSDALAQLEDGKRQIADGEKEISNAEKEVADGKKQVASNEAQMESQLADGRNQLNSGLAQLQQGEIDLAAGKQQLQESINSYQPLLAQYGSMTLAQITKDIQDGEARLADGYKRLEEGRKQLENAQRQINSTSGAIRQRYIDGYNQNLPVYQQGLAEYNQGLQQLNDAKRQMEPVFALGYPNNYTINQVYNSEIGKYQAQIAESERQLQQGWADYNNGVKQYDSGKASGEKQLANGREAITDGEKRIEDGKKQLQDAKAQLANGERQYEEGLELLALVQSMKSTSYVNDRTVNPGYGNFEEDCDRISALSDVFPFIFFMVAALVALTTMTRMVDVKRTEIGAMRAMGFSGASIGISFLLYGLFASAFGSVSGFFIGSELLPRIIINAYRALYSLPAVKTAFYWPYLLFCAVFGTFLVLVATAWGCASLFRESPARLSQPKAPVPGRRILLERIRFVWKNLAFRTKVMYRNIFRYKKRLVLTVIGIAGTAALIITAFGLQDSVGAIAGQFSTLNNSDLVLYMSDSATPQNKADILATLEADSQVEEYAPMYGMTTSVTDGAKVEHAVFFGVPLDEAQLRKIITVRNRITKQALMLEEGKCIITEKMAELLGLKEGDEMEFDLNGKLVQMPISGICENYAGHFIYLSASTYKEIAGKDPDYNLVYISNPDQQSVRDVATKMNSTNGVAMVVWVSSSLEYYQKSTEGINVAVLVIIYSAACLAFAVIYNLNNITITERLREIATLKVVGYYDFDVSKYLYRENAFLTVFGILAGQFLGYFLFMYLVRTIETNIVMFGRELNLSSML